MKPHHFSWGSKASFNPNSQQKPLSTVFWQKIQSDRGSMAPILAVPQSFLHEATSHSMPSCRPSPVLALQAWICQMRSWIPSKPAEGREKVTMEKPQMKGPWSLGKWWVLLTIPMFGQFLLSTKIFWNKPTLGLGNVSGDPKLSACGGCRRFLGNIYYSVQIGTMNHVYEPLVTWDEYPQGMAQFHKLRKKLKKIHRKSALQCTKSAKRKWCVLKLCSCW